MAHIFLGIFIYLWVFLSLCFLGFTDGPDFFFPGNFSHLNNNSSTTTTTPSPHYLCRREVAPPFREARSPLPIPQTVEQRWSLEEQKKEDDIENPPCLDFKNKKTATFENNNKRNARLRFFKKTHLIDTLERLFSRAGRIPPSVNYKMVSKNLNAEIKKKKKKKKNVTLSLFSPSFWIFQGSLLLHSSLCVCVNNERKKNSFFVCA